MDNPQGLITRTHCCYENPYPEDIINVLERDTLALEFLVDTVDMFYPALELRLDFRFGELALDLSYDFFDIIIFLFGSIESNVVFKIR